MKSLTRWQKPESSLWSGFGPLLGLRTELLDRLFDGPLSDWVSGHQLLSVWNPAVDLYEDKDNVTVKAELPGMKKEDIEVSLEGGVLSISGERKSEKKAEDSAARRTERFVGRFERTLTLPAAVKADQVQANYKDGILTITLPKAEEAKSRQITINATN